MKIYPVIGTGCAVGLNSSKTERDIAVQKAMESAIRQAVEDGCNDEETKIRMLEARDRANVS